MEHFKDRPDDYIQWIREHPDGYVMNLARTPPMIHFATCMHVREYPPSDSRPQGWLYRNMLCDERKDPLVVEARRIGGRERCRTCDA